DGKFDNNRYNAIVNQMGMTADQYAQALRNQLTTQQLINGVAGMAGDQLCAAPRFQTCHAPRLIQPRMAIQQIAHVCEAESCRFN
ncbi:SurA N-terminal domain-containing protein, partial [Salmonella enterica subsp. enterica serovar Anatum]|nr:SurA N-terminal domain-containing protein [Salmonella enterica subsp. enterica serovar Anatum]